MPKKSLADSNNNRLDDIQNGKHPFYRIEVFQDL